MWADTRRSVRTTRLTGVTLKLEILQVLVDTADKGGAQIPCKDDAPVATHQQSVSLRVVRVEMQTVTIGMDVCAKSRPVLCIPVLFP